MCVLLLCVHARGSILDLHVCMRVSARHYPLKYMSPIDFSNDYETGNKMYVLEQSGGEVEEALVALQVVYQQHHHIVGGGVHQHVVVVAIADPDLPSANDNFISI